MVTHVMTDRFHAIGSNTRLWRDTLIFLGGAEALHALSHLWLGASGMLPLTVPVVPSVAMTLTPGLNVFAIVLNGAIAAGLLYGAHYLKR
jgi:hypothetical protein